MKHNYKLMENVSDISSYVALSGFIPVDSRAMVGKIIDWSEEFETIHKNTKWSIDMDYMDEIEAFSLLKIKEAIELGYFQ